VWRQRATSRPAASGPDAAARLALEVAALDERFAAISAPTDEERAVHAMTRARLTERLAALLAKPGGAA
jgi:hypothetical protein